jgi:multidrug resistance efflux pump
MTMTLIDLPPTAPLTSLSQAERALLTELAQAAQERGQDPEIAGALTRAAQGHAALSTLLAHLTTALASGDADTARALLETQYGPIQELDENQTRVTAALAEVGAATAQLQALCRDGAIPPALLTTAAGVEQLAEVVQGVSAATQELLLRLTERRAVLTVPPAVSTSATAPPDPPRPRFTRTVGRS